MDVPIATGATLAESVRGRIAENQIRLKWIIVFDV
jgi:hypothetical protein